MRLSRVESQMPEVRVKESSFVKGKSQRLVISRSAVAESQHPLNRQGITEKTITIPGVSEMVCLSTLLALLLLNFLALQNSCWRSIRAPSRTCRRARR